MTSKIHADSIYYNGRFHTLNKQLPIASAVAITAGKFIAVGTDAEILGQYQAKVQIDLKDHTIIPGLNDSHLHIIRGGLNYNLELRWDGVTSLAHALEMLQQQVKRTPAPQWVRVVGGWTEFQFKERRMPTLEEINKVAPETPVFILHLYDRALLNRAALRAAGFTKNTADPPGGYIERDKRGEPTGLIIAKPNAMILYATLAKGPKLPFEYQLNSTRHFMRELNRLAVTSAIDAGGGFQNYPDDYKVIQDLAKLGQLTVRIAYNLFTQRPNQEFDDFAKWVTMTKPGDGDDYFRVNGAGEMLVFSAADFEDFLEPRPDLTANMETQLKAVVKLLAEKRWPFRLHATYDESITRFLNVFEEVNREIPFNGLHWFFDHAETISERNIERIKALQGGIAIQHRMAYQGEYFIDRYGKKAAENTPPITKMLAADLPVGAGTDATRVASYNPFVSLYWLISGKTVGGTKLYSTTNRLSREQALELYTIGSAWFSNDQNKKGAIAVGQLADFAALTADFFAIPEEDIKKLESVLTVVGGQVVYGKKDFQNYDPEAFPVMPDWSPVGKYNGYYHNSQLAKNDHSKAACSSHKHRHYFWGDFGCDCFVF